MTRTELSWSTLGVVALAAGCGGSSASTDETTPPPQGPAVIHVTAEMGHPHAGDAAPDFELPDAEGNPVRLSSFRGKPVVLSFVASWCPFSTAQQPNLARTAREYEGQNVQFLTVDVEEADAGYQEYIGREPMPMPVLHDAQGEHVMTYVPPQAQPNIERDRWKVLVSSNLVIDPEGVIRFYALPDLQRFDAELVHARAALDEVLAAAPAAVPADAPAETAAP